MAVFCNYENKPSDSAKSGNYFINGTNINSSVFLPDSEYGQNICVG